MFCFYFQELTQQKEKTEQDLKVRYWSLNLGININQNRVKNRKCQNCGIQQKLTLCPSWL